MTQQTVLKALELAGRLIGELDRPSRLVRPRVIVDAIPKGRRIAAAPRLGRGHLSSPPSVLGVVASARHATFYTTGMEHSPTSAAASGGSECRGASRAGCGLGGR